MFAIVASTLLVVAAPVRDLAGKYLVVVATEQSEGAANLDLEKQTDGSAVVVATDDYEGLRPHLYLVVESVHDEAATANGRCVELRKKGTQCYVRRAGTRASIDAQRLAPQKEAALAAVPARGTIDFAGRIEKTSPLLSLVVVSYPLRKNRNRYVPTEKDHATSVFLFVGERQVEIKDHDLLKPGERVFEDIQCGAIKLLPLGESGTLPAALAQRCNHEGNPEHRFLLFGAENPESPVKGVATSSRSVYPDAPHERFVPDDDPKVPGGISPRRGDGRTVVEGIEGKKAGPGPDDFLVRDFSVVWSNGKLVRQQGAWHKLTGE